MFTVPMLWDAPPVCECLPQPTDLDVCLSTHMHAGAAVTVGSAINAAVWCGKSATVQKKSAISSLNVCSKHVPCMPVQTGQKQLCCFSAAGRLEITVHNRVYQPPTS